jgi:quercetin dioxygenase-like cupin family protein
MAAQGPAIKNAVLSDAPLTGNDNLHVLIARSEWAVKAAVGRHYLQGDEYGFVLQGELEIAPDDGKAHIYTAGQAFHNARGAIYAARNHGSQTMILIEVLVVDRNSPPLVMVK